MVSAVAGGTYLYLSGLSSVSVDPSNGSSMVNNTSLESDVAQLLLVKQCMTESSNHLNSIILNNINLIGILNPISNEELVSFLENQNGLAYNLSKTAFYVSCLANSTLQNIYRLGIQNNDSLVISQMSFNVSSISDMNTEVYIQYQVLMNYENYLVKLSTVPFKISFIESGLPMGSKWSISINGITEYSSNKSIQFNELFGHYTYYANSSTPNLFRSEMNNITVSENLTEFVNFSVIKQSVTKVILHISYPSGVPILIAYNGTQTANLTLPGFSFTPGLVYNYTFNLMDQSSSLYIYNLTVQNQSNFAILNTNPVLPWQVQMNGGAGVPFSFTVRLNTSLLSYDNVLNFYINADIFAGYT